MWKLLSIINSDKLSRNYDDLLFGTQVVTLWDRKISNWLYPSVAKSSLKNSCIEIVIRITVKIEWFAAVRHPTVIPPKFLKNSPTTVVGEFLRNFGGWTTSWVISKIRRVAQGYPTVEKFLQIPVSALWLASPPTSNELTLVLHPNRPQNCIKILPQLLELSCRGTDRQTTVDLGRGNQDCAIVDVHVMSATDNVIASAQDDPITRTSYTVHGSRQLIGYVCPIYHRSVEWCELALRGVFGSLRPHPFQLWCVTDPGKPAPLPLMLPYRKSL